MLNEIGKREVFEFDPAVIASKNADGSGTFKPNAVQWRYTEYIDVNGEGRSFNVDYRNDTEVFVEFAFLEDQLRQTGQLLPVIYKDDSPYSGYQGTDYGDIYWYTGKETFNGQTYDRWRKIDGSGYGVDDSWSQYIFTNQIINHYYLFYDFNGNIVKEIIYKDEDSSNTVYQCPFTFYNNSTEDASLNSITSQASLPLVVMLPDSVKGYHYGELWGLDTDRDTEYVTLPNGYSSIDMETFLATNLKKIDLPSTMKQINDYAFWQTGLQTLRIPKGVTTIGTCAFADCFNLRYAIVPDTITSMGEGVFEGTSCKIYYEGSELPIGGWTTDWSGSGTIYLYSEDLPTSIFESWYYDEHGQPQQRPSSERVAATFKNSTGLVILDGVLPARVNTYRLNSFTIQVRKTGNWIPGGIAPMFKNAEIISTDYDSSTGTLTVEFMPTGPVEFDFMMAI